MSELVTIIMATYNRVEYLEESITSLLAQSYKNVELIVIDDGSTDATSEVLERYQSKISCRKIANSGRAAALNLGLTLARGEYVIMADDDDVLLPHAVETHLRVLRSFRQAGFSYSPHFRGVTGANKRIVQQREASLPSCSDDDLFSTLLVHMIFTLQGVMVRTDCYRAIGEFDSKMRRGQDYDVLLRLARKFGAVAVSEPTVIVREHEGDRGGANDRFNHRLRFQRGLPYLSTLFERLYSELELREYLPRRMAVDICHPAVRREALLQRISVMMRKGVWHKALADLCLAKQPLIELGPLSEREAWACKNATRNPESLVALVGHRDMRERLAGVFSDPAYASLSKHFLKGAYWAGVELQRTNRIGDAASVACLTSSLIARALIARALDRESTLEMGV